MNREVIAHVFGALEKAEGALNAPNLHLRLLKEREVPCHLAEVEAAVNLLHRVGAISPSGRKGYWRAMEARE